MGRPKAVLSGENTVPVQGEIPGFEQKRIPKIETWAAKFDAKRELINGLKGEQENCALKLREAFHENEEFVDKQETADGGVELVYKRGDWNISVTRGSEKVKVKVKEASKGDEPLEVDGDAGSND